MPPDFPSHFGFSNSPTYPFEPTDQPPHAYSGHPGSVSGNPGGFAPRPTGHLASLAPRSHDVGLSLPPSMGRNHAFQQSPHPWSSVVQGGVQPTMSSQPAQAQVTHSAFGPIAAPPTEAFPLTLAIPSGVPGQSMSIRVGDFYDGHEYQPSGHVDRNALTRLITDCIPAELIQSVPFADDGRQCCVKYSAWTSLERMRSSQTPDAEIEAAYGPGGLESVIFALTGQQGLVQLKGVFQPNIPSDFQVALPGNEYSFLVGPLATDREQPQKWSTALAMLESVPCALIGRLERLPLELSRIQYSAWSDKYAKLWNKNNPDLIITIDFDDHGYVQNYLYGKLDGNLRIATFQLPRAS